MTNTLVLETLNLTKNYGRLCAVDNLSLQVAKGEVFGILGPNGSGKTTTLSLVTGILAPDTGNYSWFGEGTHPSLRQRIGPLIEIPHFYPYLSLTDNLKLIARIKSYGYNDIDRVLHVTRLAARSKSRFSTLSLGMKQRLGIAAALLGDPEVLVLDEPTNGLDPEGIAEVRALITEQAASGKTIIMASHILSEVEKVCTSLAILKKGKLIEQGSVKTLLGGENIVELAADEPDKLKLFIRECPFITSVSQTNGSQQVSLAAGKTASDLNRYFFEKGIVLTKLLLLKKNLESQFLELVKDTPEL
jgi:ABC-2 type transport system ATP-binding protein